MLAGLSLPRHDGGRLVLAVDVSSWLCLDGRARRNGSSATSTAVRRRPRSSSRAGLNPSSRRLEPGATSWTATLDAVRLGPVDDATAVTAAQLRGVVERLITAGQWPKGDPHIVIVSDAGYDVTRLASVLRDLPVELVGRVRSDRVMRLPKPTRRPGTNGRRHGTGSIPGSPTVPHGSTTTANCLWSKARCSG
ncbi:transposase [Streptomyces sp. NPDC048445]|uniref:transposase n=1 Tax=Streptomyces sp. NPDC048445 TaxID=3365553 RepID=UPI0037248049